MAKKLSQSKLNKKVQNIIQDYLSNLEHKINIQKAILFGSAARGEMHRDSDIDLIILSNDFKKMDFIDRIVLLTRLRRNMTKSAAMDIFGYTPAEFNRLSQESIILNQAKKEGIFLYEPNKKFKKM